MKSDNVSSTEKRLVTTCVNIKQNSVQADEIGFMPTGLCHVYFPYNNPGPETTTWVRQLGNYILSIEATSEWNPLTKQMERSGLPFGGKSRWILTVLNSLALKHDSPEVYLGSCLTDFIGNTLKFHVNGRIIKEIKDHLTRLAAADLKLTYQESLHTTRERMGIMDGFAMWHGEEGGHKGIWNDKARFSSKYYNDLKQHAVPLDLRALWGLVHKPMAIDLYATLAYRLHNLTERIFVPWVALKEQFGYNYKEMFHFKADFRKCLDHVKTVYPDAVITPHADTNKGFWFYPSRPPIAPRQYAMPQVEYVPVPVHNLPPGKKKKSATGTKNIGATMQDMFPGL